jgi:hypothetical protein
VEQGCGEDDQEEADREDLTVTCVSVTAGVIGRARICAVATRTKDSPMMVLMPAMLGMPTCLHNLVSSGETARRRCMYWHVPDGVMTLCDLRVMVVG